MVDLGRNKERDSTKGKKNTINKTIQNHKIHKTIKYKTKRILYIISPLFCTTNISNIFQGYCNKTFSRNVLIDATNSQNTQNNKVQNKKKQKEYYTLLVHYSVQRILAIYLRDIVIKPFLGMF